MKKIVSLLLIIAVLFSFVGCRKIGEVDALVTIGSYVPTLCLYDYKDLHSKTLETDDYGRELVVIASNNSMIYESMTFAVVIMQKRDKHIYYYDDVFYFIHKSGVKKISDFKASELNMEKVEALKKSNDWQKPLNKSKMTKKENAVALGGHIKDKWLSNNNSYFEKVKEKVAGETGVNVEDVWIHLVDNDNESLMLCLAYIDNGHGDYTVYFVIVGEKHNIKYEELENIYDYNEQIKNFKQSCGWNY